MSNTLAVDPHNGWRLLDCSNPEFYEGWVNDVAKALTNTKRWGGMHDNAISVAAHSIWVFRSVLLESYPLVMQGKYLTVATYALFHEIEEAFGVGDICSYVKHEVVDRKKLNKYIAKLFDAFGIKHSQELHNYIKQHDIAVGLAEAANLNIPLSWLYGGVWEEVTNKPSWKELRQEMNNNPIKDPYKEFIKIAKDLRVKGIRNE